MTLLRKLFIIFLCVLILPTTVLMGINYFQTQSFFEEEAKLSNHKIAKQAKVANDSIISQTERISQQIAIYSSIQELLTEPLDPVDYDDYQILDDSYNIMLSFKNGTQYIDEIAVYNLKEDLLVSTSITESPATSVKSTEYLIKLSETSPMKLWIKPNASGVFWEQTQAFQYVRFMYTNTDELLGFIVIRLRNTDFDRLINEMYIDDEGILFVADQTGKIILSPDSKYRNIIDLDVNFEWISNEENYEIRTISGEEYFISLVTSDYNNWKYISLVNTAPLVKKLLLIRNNMLVLLIFFIVISLVLSRLLSKIIYTPIQSIQVSLDGESKKMKNRWLLGEKEFGQINDEISILLNEIKSEKEVNIDYKTKLEVLNEAQESVKKKLSKYNLYRVFKGEYLSEEEAYKIHDKFADESNEFNRILVIELMEYNGDIFDLENPCVSEYFYETSTRIICLLKECNEFDKFLNSLKEHLDKYEKSCIIVLSDPVSFDGLKVKYDYLLKIIKYKLIKNDLGIIYEKDFSEKKEIKRLPYDYHTYLNNSLRIASLEGCKTIVMELSQVLKSDFYFASNYTFYFKDILNTIIGYLYEIQYIKSQNISDITNTFSSFEEKLDTIDKAEKWTIQFISNVFTFIRESKLVDNESTIHMAVKIIEKEYINDISLADVAEKLGMSPPYLSKQFKEEIGINFKEYLTKCKIERAKQLLLSSDDIIQNIAEQVGYNNSLQLVRMFKKMENLTPTEYRHRNKKR